MINKYILFAAFGFFSISGLTGALARPRYYITSNITGALYVPPIGVGTLHRLVFEEINNAPGPVTKYLLLVHFDGPDLLVPAAVGTCFVARDTQPPQDLYLQTDKEKCKLSLKSFRVLPGLSYRDHQIYDSKLMLYLAPSVLRKNAVLSLDSSYLYNLVPTIG